MAYGFSLNISRCSGCMACVVACMDQNNAGETGNSFRSVTKLEQGSYPTACISFVTLACFHCSDAPCVQVCPKQAIFKDESRGIIDVDTERCIGCHICAMVCPFGAPRFLPGEKMSKCNMCIDRIAEGKEPACVHTCPTRALGFGTLAALSRKKAEEASIKILTK